MAADWRNADSFCPSLKIMGDLFGLNEHLAGMTLLAFGNGAPDLFTSLSSMYNPSRMMFSDLFGAGIFVSSVVGGTICLLAPFKMQPINLLRDCSFYIFTTVYIEYIMTSDMHITILESIGVLTIYFFYVLTNFLDQFLVKRYIRQVEAIISNTKFPTDEQTRLLEDLRDQAGIDMMRGSRASVNTEIARNDLGPPNKNIFKQFMESINPFEREEYENGNAIIKGYALLKVPFNFILLFTIPITDYSLTGNGWSKLLNTLQLVVMPFSLIIILFPNLNVFDVPVYIWTLFPTILFSILVFFTSRTDLPPRYHSIFTYISVAGSITVIYSTASETVQIFYVLGILSNFSNAFLGCTLLAWGNSIGDLVADVALSKAGYQKMGFAACYGGPLFNTLLAMGIQMLIKSVRSPTGAASIPQGQLGENCCVFLIVILVSTLLLALSTNFAARRSFGVFFFLLYIISLSFSIMGEIEAYDWGRSISEPDLTDPFKQLNRFAIKHPHEYISVDDLKYFRRKKPPDLHTRSNICLYDRNETVLPFGALKSEYKTHFCHYDLSVRPTLLRRATSLRLEGLMHHKSEHQEQYHWYTPQDWKICRSYPIRNPESLRLSGDINMDPEYRSSYISYPMVDRTTKILPREMFRIEPDPVAKNLERSPEEVAAINKLAEDKFKRDIAARQQQKCHLQQRAAETKYITTPSEYTRQYVQFPIEKAHSIPQISHIKLQGDFVGVPEYQDSFKMYANYSKSAPIKKLDNLRFSGAEEQNTAADQHTDIPEYREKFCDPPKKVSKDKPLKTDDHLRSRGEFSKDMPEYYESFRDPQIKQMPERGKCREPYLRLKGKLEFNPEYRNTYLDFPRSRPVLRKPVSCFRLPTASTSTTSMATEQKSPKHSPRRKYKSSSPNRVVCAQVPSTDITVTPEYRRAHYNYQLRERTPPRKVIESDGGGNSKFVSLPGKTRKSSDSSLEHGSKLAVAHKRRTRTRQASIVNTHATQTSFENLGGNVSKKQAKFGRRASVLQNAANCREHFAIVEGNTKPALSRECENRDSFLVLDEPCKRSNWMKKSWYES